jgi:hypothetical protein
MYRIELTPGEVTVFRTIEELATGVRNGLITPKARIYHNASDKWLPIEFHPHYKQALDLNAAHTGEAGQKHGATASKQSSPKQGSPKQGSPKQGSPKQGSPKQASPDGGGSKPRSDGFTFLNVPLSPVTPLPRSKPRVADLPYIEDDAPAAAQPATPPSQDHSPDRSRMLDAAAGRLPIEDSPAHDAPRERTRVGHAPAEIVPPVEHPVVRHTPVDHVRPDDSTAAAAPRADAPIQRSPGYDLDDEPSLGQPSSRHEAAQQTPAHHSAPYQPAADHPAAHSAPEYQERVADRWPEAAADHGAPARYSAVEPGPAYDAAPAHRHPFKPVLVDATPIYRSPAERSANHEAAAHAAFEAHLPPEPVRIEDPIRDAPRSRLAVEQLFAPPAPRAASLPPVTASPVLELPHISYPEITPVEPPVAEPSSGGSRARRTLHLVGAVLLLAAGGYASTTVFSFGREDGGFNAAATMADRPVVPVGSTTPAPSAPAPSRVDTRPPTTSATARTASPHASSPKALAPAAGSILPGSLAPAADEPLPPASSGFAPALESRAIVTVPLKLAPKPEAVTDSSAIAPVIDMQVTAPELQGAESLAVPPRQKGDSAMKRILRAVSGK